MAVRFDESAHLLAEDVVFGSVIEIHGASTSSRTENRQAEVVPDRFEFNFHRKVERESFVVTIDQPRGHAYTLFQFNHRSHEGDVGGKRRVQGLVGDGPGKKRTLAAAALPRKFRRAALRAHIARQVAEGAAIAATLEIEMAVLAPLPEFLLDRVLWARSRLGRHLLRGGPHFGRQIASRRSCKPPEDGDAPVA